MWHTNILIVYFVSFSSYGSNMFKLNLFNWIELFRVDGMVSEEIPIRMISNVIFKF